MSIYFSSDYHLGHFNIIKYCKRPYTTIAEMNDNIIQNHNSVIKPNDTFYFLGDFAMTGSYEYLSSLMKRLNGDKHIILGNHDKSTRFEPMVKDGLIKSLNQVLMINIYKQAIWLSHYPHLSWNRSGHGSWNLHGHCHATLKPGFNPFRIDVGIDNWNYFPVSFEQILKFKEDEEKKIDDKQNALEWGVYQ